MVQSTRISWSLLRQSVFVSMDTLEDETISIKRKIYIYIYMYLYMCSTSKTDKSLPYWSKSVIYRLMEKWLRIPVHVNGNYFTKLGEREEWKIDSRVEKRIRLISGQEKWVKSLIITFISSECVGNIEIHASYVRNDCDVYYHRMVRVERDCDTLGKRTCETHYADGAIWNRSTVT